MKLRVTLLPLLAALSAPALAQNAPPASQPDNKPAAQPAPQPATKPETKAPPAEKVYDESADAGKQVDAALAKAAKENQRVLIQWGGNWCPWCIKLHAVFKSDKAIARELMYEYVVVNVDIGRFNKNLDLAEKYRADLKSGVPYLTLLDAKGNVVVNQETGALESKEPGKSEHDTKAVLEFLKKHRAEPVAAGNALDHALSLARAENKRVFLHFGAPWCGWCHKLEAWMARPEVAALLAKDYVDLKIDTDRMTGGDDFLKKFNPKAGTPEGGGIPWIAILNADGSVVVDSNGPKGNTGFPAADEEIAHFATMLSKSSKNLSTEEQKILIESLKAQK